MYGPLLGTEEKIQRKETLEKGDVYRDGEGVTNLSTQQEQRKGAGERGIMINSRVLKKLRGKVESSGNT